LKKHKKTSSTVESVFSASVQDKMYKEVLRRLYHGDRVGDHVQRKVGKIIKVLGERDRRVGRPVTLIFLFLFWWLFFRVILLAHLITMKPDISFFLCLESLRGVIGSFCAVCKLCKLSVKERRGRDRQ
jgi:hypothetical protein